MHPRKTQIGFTLLAAVLLLPVAQAAFAQDAEPAKPNTAKQDIKKAGHETKAATKDTGHAIAKTSKTAAKDTQHGTETAAKKTGHATKTAAGKTKAGTKKVVHGAATHTAQAADKVEDKTAPQ